MPRHPVRKPTTLGPSLTGRLIAVATSLVFLAVAMLASPAQAVDVPPPGVDLFLQTRVLLVTASGLLIVVGVVLDTMRQLEAQLLMRHYEGFIK